MPVDWSRYPADWGQVVERIRARSGNKCEWCGARNGAIGRWLHREAEGSRFEEAGPLVGKVTWENLKAAGLTRIILTTAHLGTPHADGRPGDKHDKMDVRDENLAHLCQRCHLRYDLPEHMENARRTRNRKKGQVDMFDTKEA